jgi:hypothetical protein
MIRLLSAEESDRLIDRESGVHVLDGIAQASDFILISIMAKVELCQQLPHAINFQA